jgi:hypothetical protein
LIRLWRCRVDRISDKERQRIAEVGDDDVGGVPVEGDAGPASSERLRPGKSMKEPDWSLV